MRTSNRHATTRAATSAATSDSSSDQISTRRALRFTHIRPATRTASIPTGRLEVVLVEPLAAAAAPAVVVVVVATLAAAALAAVVTPLARRPGVGTEAAFARLAGPLGRVAAAVVAAAAVRIALVAIVAFAGGLEAVPWRAIVAVAAMPAAAASTTAEVASAAAGTAATAASPAGAATALFGLGHAQRAGAEHRAVQRFDGLRRLLVARHLDEREAARPLRFPVQWNVHTLDGAAAFAESSADGILVGVVREIPDVQSLAHAEVAFEWLRPDRIRTRAV